MCSSRLCGSHRCTCTACRYLVQIPSSQPAPICPSSPAHADKPTLVVSDAGDASVYPIGWGVYDAYSAMALSNELREVRWGGGGASTSTARRCCLCRSLPAASVACHWPVLAASASSLPAADPPTTPTFAPPPQVALKFLSLQTCVDEYSMPMKVETDFTSPANTMFCAGNINNFFDENACFGDSGGAVVAKAANNNPADDLIVGITSFGPGDYPWCTGTPGACTSVPVAGGGWSLAAA